MTESLSRCVCVPSSKDWNMLLLCTVASCWYSLACCSIWKFVHARLGEQATKDSAQARTQSSSVYAIRPGDLFLGLCNAVCLRRAWLAHRAMGGDCSDGQEQGHDAVHGLPQSTRLDALSGHSSDRSERCFVSPLLLVPLGGFREDVHARCIFDVASCAKAILAASPHTTSS